METLLQQIRDKFTSLGWNKELEDHDMWVNEQEVMMNMGTIIINGQQMHQQGQKKISTQIFEAQYECEVKDIETENIDKSIMCRFQVLDDGIETQYLEINFYPDEFVFFENLCKKIYGI